MRRFLNEQQVKAQLDREINFAMLDNTKRSKLSREDIKNMTLQERQQHHEQYGKFNVPSGAMEILYMFSLTELDIRMKETIEAISLMCDEDFDKYGTHDQMSHRSIVRVIADFDDIHGISYMQKLIERVENAYSDDQYLSNLTVAWHLMKAGRHNDSLVTKSFIENFKSNHLDDNNMMFNISYNLGSTLENILYDFEKRIYDAVYNDLRKRNLI